MITKLTIENFKRFGQKVEIELGSPVVFVGPNNCGKTTALQALALWETAARRWFEKRHPDVTTASERAGVPINRKDILFAPVPDSKVYWHGLHVRRGVKRKGKAATQNIRMNIVVEGATEDRTWVCGFEFDYQNAETFNIRPLRKAGFDDSPVAEAEYTVPPEAAGKVRIAYLPPMSGLASIEDRLDSGAIRRRIGEGRTAEVLRNLCYSLLHPDNNGGDPDIATQRWEELKRTMKTLFGVELLEPAYNADRGEVTMSYRDRAGTELDLSSSGRGMQQTLLLFAYLYANPGTAILLDEPDAHLEVLRQRQTYNLLVETARQLHSQVIAASHSEVVLNEAAGKDCVVAFVGSKPHVISDRGSQLVKALTTFGFENYVLGETKGWALYLEGSTDLAILKALAAVLKHQEAVQCLESPFVHYLNTNLPQSAREHFYGIRDAVPNLVGFALFDRIDKPLQSQDCYVEAAWSRREIENYLCTREVLLRFARGTEADADLFSASEADIRVKAMEKAITDVEQSLQVLDKPSPWSADCKVSDDFLRPLFKAYFAALKMPNVIAKSDYHQLAPFLQPSDVDIEVRAKLDQLVAIASKAKPASQG
ncbi:MAG: ATPase AAA [Limisphaerales bacterium]|nr:MAG: ATPase AAA [Limisphaerales bacterium]KAG0508323.1 MAG: ATPase AAA [Limisphaerales bacterium]TXT49638.1 MAG: ATPase AAA [Limisphaerales bacterium]